MIENMKILGFNFSKLNIEKYKESLNNLQIKNEVDILEVSEVKQDFFKTEEEMIGVKFMYNVIYSPDIAKVQTEGNMLIALDSKTAREILKDWKKKSLPEEFRITMINIIFRKAGLKALELEDQMNLPLHMQMPSLRKKEEK